MFNNDHMIFPKETAHFRQLNENDELIGLEESEFYRQDLLGLRKLNEEGRVTFMTLQGDHL